MANLANINVSITAVDNTGPGINSATSNLSRLGGGIGSIGTIASGVFGGILGVNVWRTISSGIGNVVSSALTLNSRMSQSQMAAASMVDAISNAGTEGESSFGTLSKAAASYEKTLREIQEREKDGLDDYADKVDDIKNRILSAQQDLARKLDDIRKKEKERLDDLNESHLESIQDLNTRVEDENYDYNERLYDMANSRQDKLDNLEESHSNKIKSIKEDLFDLENELLDATSESERNKLEAKIALLKQAAIEENSSYEAEKLKINERADHEIQVVKDKHNREIASLQERISRENSEYDKRKSRITADANNDIAESKRVSEEKIKGLNDQLAKEKESHERFLRDIQEAYKDASAKLNESMSGGGGATMKRINFDFDFNKNLKNMGQDEISKFLDEVQDKYIKIGIKSPFNIADIQEFGKTMIRYTDGSSENMEKILGIGQALAAFNPMQGIQGATFALNELFGAGNVRSLMTRFNLPPDTFKGLENAKDAAQALDILTTSLNNLGVNQELVSAYANALVGAHQNVLETFNVLAAALAKPVYDRLTNALVLLNKYIAEHYDEIKNVIAGFATLIDVSFASLINIGKTVIQFWQDHSTAISAVVGIITLALLPALAKLTIEWIANTTRGIISSTIALVQWVAQGWLAVGALIAKIVQFGLATAAAIAHTVVTIAGTAATTAWTAAVWLFNAAMAVLTSPIFLVVAAIAAVIAIGYLLIKNWDAIKAAGTSMWQALQNTVENVWKGITSAVKGGLNSIIDGINGFINGLNDKLGKTKMKIGNVEIGGWQIPTIPKLAEGGIVSNPTLAMLGEAGPEAVVPLSKSKGYGSSATSIYVNVTGNNIIDDETANTLADKVGNSILNKITLQGRYM